MYYHVLPVCQRWFVELSILNSPSVHSNPIHWSLRLRAFDCKSFPIVKILSSLATRSIQAGRFTFKTSLETSTESRWRYFGRDKAKNIFLFFRFVKSGCALKGICLVETSTWFARKCSLARQDSFASRKLTANRLFLRGLLQALPPGRGRRMVQRRQEWTFANVERHVLYFQIGCRFKCVVFHSFQFHAKFCSFLYFCYCNQRFRRLTRADFFLDPCWCKREPMSRSMPPP